MWVLVCFIINTWYVACISYFFNAWRKQFAQKYLEDKTVYYICGSRGILFIIVGKVWQYIRLNEKKKMEADLHEFHSHTWNRREE